MEAEMDSTLIRSGVLHRELLDATWTDIVEELGLKYNSVSECC